MLDFYFSLMSARLFHSRDLDGLKEGLTDEANDPKPDTRR